MPSPFPYGRKPGQTSNYPNGLVDADKNQNQAAQYLTTLDKTVHHAFFDDFNSYTTGYVAVNSATATIGVLAATEGGILSVVPAGNAATSMLQASYDGGTNPLSSFTPGTTTSNALFFKIRLSVSNATSGAIAAGLMTAGATFAQVVANTVVNGIYFYKAAASTSLSLVLTKASTPITIPNIATLANDTYVELAFYWDGQANLYTYVNNVEKTIISPYVYNALPYVPVVPLAPTFGTKNSASNLTLLVDYISVDKERSYV